MAMTSDPCEQYFGLLADFADGQLPAGPAQEIARHLAGCKRCRAHLAALRRSLALARAIWAESAAGTRAVCAAQHRAPLWKKAAAVAAACVLLGAAALMLWRPRAGRPETTGPADDGPYARDVRALVQREEASAQLAAAARILSLQPGGREAAQDAYRRLAQTFPDTSAGREAARRISDEKGAVQ